VAGAGHRSQGFLLETLSERRRCGRIPLAVKLMSLAMNVRVCFRKHALQRQSQTFAVRGRETILFFC
jgi:hypothetical protein